MQMQLQYLFTCFCTDAIIEAAESGIKVIVTITEGIPVQDMVLVYEHKVL